jgi:hypothetical protein
MNKITIAFLTGSALIALTACGGGGGGGNTTPPPVENVNANGLWEGTQSVNGTTFDAQYIVYNNRVYGYTYSGQALFSGTGTVSGTSLSSNYNIYDYDSGVKMGTGTFSGTVSPQSNITGTFENSLGQSGTVNLSFNNQYNTPSSISKVAYNYGTFAIDTSGNISGTYNGCDISGHVTTPDTSVNIYDIEYTLGNCGAYSGHYEGLGTITYINTPTVQGNVLQAGMSNDDAMTLFIAVLP